ncbi:MAG: acyl-CoA dehydrogenase family protein [candidate division WOR-3 bacterium]
MLLNISEYEEVLNFYEEINKKEIQPKRLEIDRDRDLFQQTITKLSELGVLDQENNEFTLQVRLLAIITLAKGEPSISQYVGKTWALGDLGLARSESLVQFPNERVYYNGKIAEFEGEGVEVLGLRACGWAKGKLKILEDYPFEVQQTLLFYDIATLTGISLAAMEEAENYAKERVAFGKPIYEFEEVRGFIERGKSFAEALKTALLLTDNPEKLLNLAIETAYFCTDKALQIFGGYGFINEYPVQKFLRDARMLRSLLIRMVQ